MIPMPANWQSWTDEQLAQELARLRGQVRQNSQRKGESFRYLARLDSARLNILQREQERRQVRLN